MTELINGIFRHLEISHKLYNEEVVKKVFYSFADKGAYSLDAKSGGDFVITLRFPQDTIPEVVEDRVAELHQALVDYDLRRTIGAETELVRNLILANAFGNTTLE